MKSKRAKKVRYWISYYLPNGKQRREICDHENPYSIEVANAAHGKRLAQKYENPSILERVLGDNITFSQLAKWYLAIDRVKALPRYPVIKIRLQTFNSQFGHMLVNRIRLADLQAFQTKRKSQGKADATIDDEIGVVRTIVNAAFDNDLVGGSTLKAFKKLKKFLKRNSNARDRILSLHEFDLIMEQLPGHASPIFATGYYTGMRLGEILSLTWDKVDLHARLIRLEASDTKDKEPRDVPILDEVYHILKSTPKGIHDNHVFLYMGKPINTIRKTLKRACENAGILYGRKVRGGFTFHDLRHTFNTNMRKSGVPESVIMKITGHSTRDMFDRYNTVDAQDTQKAMEQLAGFLKLQSIDQIIDQADISAQLLTSN